jgi:hypothetical protein
MAIRNPNGKMKYWFEGASASLIKPNPSAFIGYQNYWYLGQPQGFITDGRITFIARPRSFAVLIGF